MNAVATEPEWLPFVEQCEAQHGSVDQMPPLRDESGAWKCERGGVNRKGTVNCILYWGAGPRWNSRRYIRVGSFQLLASEAKSARNRHNEQHGCRTVGFDEHNRRIMRISTGALVVIDREQVRGEWLPRPIPVEVAGVATIW